MEEPGESFPPPSFWLLTSLPARPRHGRRTIGAGWSPRRLLHRVLRVSACFTVPCRRVAIIAGTASRHRVPLVRQLRFQPRTRGAAFHDRLGSEEGSGGGESIRVSRNPDPVVFSAD